MSGARPTDYAVWVVRTWHGLLAATVAFAVIGQTVVNVANDRSLVNLLSYFTVESNILVGVTAALVALSPQRDGWLFGAARLAGLVGITVTGIVYVTLLRGTVELSGWDRVFDLLFHYVVPAMAVLGFVLLRPRSPLRREHLVFLAWPLAWLAYTLVRAEVVDPAFARADGSAPVPYDFLDRADIGWGAVLLNSSVVLAIGCVLAFGHIRLSGRGGETRS